NGSPSMIGQVDYTPSDEVELALGGIYGPEQSCNPRTSINGVGAHCNRNKRGLVDLVVTLEPTDALTVLLNFDWASEEEAAKVHPGRQAQWGGFSGIVSYELTDWLVVSARGEWFDDTQGARTELRQRLWEETVSFKILLTEYLYLRGEYRHD